MIKRPLKSMPYAQAKVIIDDDGCTYLCSYKTIVAGIIDGKMFCNGLYSATTRKHLGAFAKEFGYTYETMKLLKNNNFVLDMKTGELLDRVS